MLAALPEEARGILKTGCWKEVASSESQAMYERGAGNGGAFLVITGMGRIRAESAARAVLKQRSPDAVLSLGFAGGLAPGQRAGDLIVAQTIIPAEADPGGERNTRAGEAIHADRALTRAALRLLGASALRHQAGTCVTASQVISGADSKRRLGLSSKALAVDMESFWIGGVCGDLEIPFLATRAIVDTVERPMPAFVSEFAARDSRWRSALSAAIHPGALPELIRLAAAASKARNSLSNFAAAFLKEWRPSAAN